CEIDLRASATNCGACGSACSAAHGTGGCSMGRCTVALCDPDWFDCDNDPANGCETNLVTDAKHCGACSHACMFGPHSTAVCSGGACGLACDPGFADCDLVAASGCEIALDTDAGNCGGCGRACALPNAAAGCAAGKCVIAMCKAGHGDCNQDPKDGCETSLTGDVKNCGGCGMTCPT